MNGASLCNSVLLHPPSLSRLHSSCSFAYSYLVYPCSISEKRNRGFCSFARKSNDSIVIESESGIDEDEDWGELDEEDEDEGEFLPMEKMKKWLEKKPRGFGLGKKYETTIEDKLLDEIEQSWKAQAANLNNLKNTDPLKPKPNSLIKGLGETQVGFRVRVTNLPKKKNVHRDLKVAFKQVTGVSNIAPAVSGNKKTKDPVCKGFALIDFKAQTDANRFVEEFDGMRLAFGKVVKQIKCQLVDSSSNQLVSQELRSDTVFQELPFTGFQTAAHVALEEEDHFLDSGEESDHLDEEVDEAQVEEDEQNRISSTTNIESPVELRRDQKTDLRSQKQVVKPEIRDREELETPLVSFEATESKEGAVAETSLDDDELDSAHVEQVAQETTVAEARIDDDLDRADDVEQVAGENLKPLKSSVSSSDVQRIDRIRKLELKLLGREKLLGGGADSNQPEAKPGNGVEGKKKEKKKKKKILVKGKNASKIEIPGSSKRLKVKEKALLTGVLIKYAAKAASTSSNDK